jgi:hypothetical protein
MYGRVVVRDVEGACRCTKMPGGVERASACPARWKESNRVPGGPLVGSIALGVGSALELRSVGMGWRRFAGPREQGPDSQYHGCDQGRVPEGWRG